MINQISIKGRLSEWTQGVSHPCPRCSEPPPLNWSYLLESRVPTGGYLPALLMLLCPFTAPCMINPVGTNSLWKCSLFLSFFWDNVNDLSAIMDSAFATPLPNVVYFIDILSGLLPSGPSANNCRAKMSTDLSYSIISQSACSGLPYFFPYSLSKQYWLSSMWAVMKGHPKCKLSILDQFWRANMLWRPHNGRFHLIFTQGTFTQ